MLVAFTVAHGALLGLLQRRLQRLDAFHGGAQTLLQLGQFAAQVGVVADELAGEIRANGHAQFSKFTMRLQGGHGFQKTVFQDFQVPFLPILKEFSRTEILFFKEFSRFQGPVATLMI